MACRRGGVSVPVKERAFLGHVTPYCFFKNPPSLGEALSEWESYCNPRGRKSETIPAAPLDLKMASGREDGSGVFFRDVSQFLCVFPAQGADGIATRTAHGEGKRKKYFSEEGGTFFGFFSYFFSSLCELLGDLNIRVSKWTFFLPFFLSFFFLFFFSSSFFLSNKVQCDHSSRII